MQDVIIDIPCMSACTKCSAAIYFSDGVVDGWIAITPSQRILCGLVWVCYICIVANHPESSGTVPEIAYQSHPATEL